MNAIPSLRGAARRPAPARASSRTLPGSALVALASLVLVGTPGLAGEEAAADAAQPVPLVHLQTDRGSYRLGETLWYRVHLGEHVKAAFPLRVELVQGDKVLAAARLASPKQLKGKLLLEAGWLGGQANLKVSSQSGQLLHTLAVDLYDVKTQRIGVRLRILGELYVPGDTLTATVHVTDAKGRPLAKRALQARAQFGDLVVEQAVGPTDAEGWAVVRLKIPADVRGSGHLAVGLETKKRLGVAAATVRVSAGVARVDAFPEGGAIVTGHAQRLALWIRDPDGGDAEVEGRVLDDRGEKIASFATDRHGHALIDVPYLEGRSYSVAVDRPAIAKRFPLPKDTGHAASLRLEHDEKGRLRVEVRTREGETLKSLEAHLGDRKAFTRREIVKKGLAVFEAPKSLMPRFVYVVAGKRVLLKAPTLVGVEHPLRVSVRIRKGDLPLPGRTVTLDVETTWLGQPISTDVALSVGHAAVRADLSNFTARALLQPLVHRGLVLEGADLVRGIVANRDRSHAFLLARGGYALPPGGVALGPKNTPPAASVGRAPAPEIAPRAPLVIEEPKTKRRRGALDQALLRAHFTRAAAPRAVSEPRVTRRLPAKRRSAKPGLGKLAKRLPQAEKVSWKKADTRSTLCWLPSLKTNASGRASVKLRLGHELAALTISAQGISRGAAAADLSYLQPLAESNLQAKFPKGLAIGDIVELWVEVSPRDKRTKTPYWLGLRVPPCLEALDRTEVRKNPRKDAPRTKFRLRALAEVSLAELQIVVQRGAFEEVHSRSFTIRPAEPTLSFSRKGTTSGRVTLQVSMPDNALPGTVRAEAILAPSTLSTVVEGLDSLLREPHGCFEQTTSSNYPNLVVLEALSAQGSDAAALDRAFALAETGFRRILSFQHTDGGFSLWGPKSGGAATPRAHYTAMGAAQLARYAALHNGRGTHSLERALAWLASHRKETTSRQSLFVAFSLLDAGRGDEVNAKVLTQRPTTLYDKALLATVLALSPAASAPAGRLTTLLDELAAAQGDQGSVSSKDKTTLGQGVMHSYGASLEVEITALAALAFEAGGRPNAASRARAALLGARQAQGGWPGTQATALAICALTQAATGPGAPEATPVTFLTPDRNQSAVLIQGRHRPLNLSSAIPSANPGDVVSIALQHRGGEELGYSLRCSYRVRDVRDASNAPYRLEVLPPAVLSAGGAGQVTVRFGHRQRTRLPAGQVVLRLALPGGMTISDLAACQKSAKAQRVEQDGSEWVFYWEQAPAGKVSFSFDVRGVTQGHFKSGVSSIYPYYEPERVAFSRARKLKVVGVGDPFPSGTSGQAGQAGQARQAVQPR